MTSSSLIANSRWNVIAFACGLVPNLVTVPFVLKLIGLAAFGRAGLVLAVCAPLVLIGTVLGQALVREASSRLGMGDAAGAQRVIDAALRLCIGAAAFGWVMLVAFGPSIFNLLTNSAQPDPALHVAFLIAATGWLVQQVTLVLQAISAARQDFRRVAQVAAFSAVANIVATLTVTSIVPLAEGYLGGIATGLAASAAAWLWALRVDVSASDILFGDRRAESRDLLRFSKWQSVAHLAGAVSNQIDRYALGALGSVTVVGQYNVANRLQEAAYLGAARGGEVLFPRFGSLSQAKVHVRGEVFQTASWVVGTFSAMALAPMLPLSGPILTLWVGTEAAQESAILLRTLVLGGLIGCGSNVFWYYAMGIGRNRPLALITVLYALVTVFFTVLLIRAFGPLAAGTGLLVASAIRVGLALGFTRRDLFPHLSWAALLVSTVVPLATGASFALAIQVIGVGPVASWAQLIAIYIAMACAIMLSTLALSSLTATGRAIISEVIRTARGHSQDEHDRAA